MKFKLRLEVSERDGDVNVHERTCDNEGCDQRLTFAIATAIRACAENSRPSGYLLAHNLDHRDHIHYALMKLHEMWSAECDFHECITIHVDAGKLLDGYDDNDLPPHNKVLSWLEEKYFIKVDRSGLPQ